MGKKIVVVNAGPRKGWNTDILLSEASDGAISAGAEIQRFDLFKLERYTGCISFSYEDGGEIHTTDPKTTICPISPSYIDVSSEYNIMVKETVKKNS